MPRGDGTGPFGTFVNCMPVDYQGNVVPFGRRRFFRRGFGMGGRGFRWRYFQSVPGWFNEPQPTKEQEKQELNMQLKEAKKEISDIKKRLEELEKGDDNKQN